MAYSYSCSINPDPTAVGNMYYRGTWEYCPEYKTGDVVLHNGVMYLCTKPHAGKEPALKDSADYWHTITPSNTEESTTITRKVMDGGFASTLSKDSYEDTDLVDEINGGSASDRVFMPLI